jgi:hypothetical protein
MLDLNGAARDRDQKFKYFLTNSDDTAVRLEGSAVQTQQLFLFDRLLEMFLSFPAQTKSGQWGDLIPSPGVAIVCPGRLNADARWR